MKGHDEPNSRQMLLNPILIINSGFFIKKAKPTECGFAIGSPISPRYTRKRPNEGIIGSSPVSEWYYMENVSKVGHIPIAKVVKVGHNRSQVVTDGHSSRHVLSPKSVSSWPGLE